MATIKILSFLMLPLVAVEFGYRAAKRRFLLRHKARMEGSAA